MPEQKHNAYCTYCACKLKRLPHEEKDEPDDPDAPKYSMNLSVGGLCHYLVSLVSPFTYTINIIRYFLYMEKVRYLLKPFNHPVPLLLY